MLYSYNGIDEKLVYKSYRVVGENIVVTTLDGKEFSLNNTATNMKYVLDKMIEFAINRDNSNRWSELEESINKDMLEVKLSSAYLAMHAMMFAGTYNIARNSGDYLLYSLPAVFSLASSGFSYLLFKYKLDYKEKYNELSDLEKYRIFLSIRDLLLKYKDRNDIYLNTSKSDLNINSIDTFTKEELMIIRSNLERRQIIDEIKNK